MRIILTILAAAAILMMAGPSTSAPLDTATIVAQSDEHAVEPANAMRQGRCPSLSQAVEQVRRQYNGRIVGAETRVSGGRETHIIKVLTSDGRVKTVRIPGCPV